MVVIKGWSVNWVGRYAGFNCIQVIRPRRSITWYVHAKADKKKSKECQGTEKHMYVIVNCSQL